MRQHPLYAPNFNGFNNYITCGSDASLRITGNLTITSWIKPALIVAGDHAIICKWNGVGKRSYLLLVTLAGKVLGYVSANGTALVSITSITTLQKNTWYHVAFVHNADTDLIELYLNGVSDAIPVAHATNIFDSTNLAVVELGMRDTHTFSPFDGLIGETHIYNRILDTSEIQRNMRNPLNPLRSGLVLFLPMIEGSGANVNDYSGYGNNGSSFAGSWNNLTKYEIPAAIGL